MVFDLRRIASALLIAVSLFVALVSPAFAASTVNLYEESVVVKQNANQKEQKQAIEVAFRELLVRLTGVTNVLEHDAIIPELKEGAKYVASSRFGPSDVFFTNSLSENIPTKTFLIKFDRKSVDALLVQNRLPLWGAKRPDVLVWIADRIEGSDHILGGAEDTLIGSHLSDISKSRGVPYVLPIMDLTDTLNLSFTDLYGLFSRDIEAASERYPVEAILAGRLSGTEGDYSADWLMMFKGERLRLPTVTGTLSEVVERGVDLASQRLSEQYAFVLDPLLLGTLSLNIINIESAVQFAAVENYLKSINLITKVTSRTFEGTNVSFDVEISGDQFQLADMLELDNQLLPI